MYECYKNSGYYDFNEFFRRYVPEITPRHHTCVGLAFELWKRLLSLEDKYPGLTSYLFLVSCEENIDAIESYSAYGDRLDDVARSLEKEHVLLALRFEIEGRTGVLLCDPGYHVARVVTVMSDKLYPHTGWFRQSSEGNSNKDYNYCFSDDTNKFVAWSENNTNANGVSSSSTGLIYVVRPYLTAVDVTERRNLVYNFKSLLSRSKKGQVLAGIYFKLKENSDEFTIFYQDGEKKKRLKLNFSIFLHPEKIDESVRDVVRMCSEQLNQEEETFLGILSSLAEVTCNKSFVRSILEINHQIGNMGED